MALPVVSISSMKKKNKPSAVLTLSSAGLLIGGGMIAAYWLFAQGQIFSRELPIGANIIPQDALFAVSLTTDPGQWQKLREFGTKETQAELDKNLVQWRDRLLTNNGYDFQKDISPWVGKQVTIAIVAPQASKEAPKSLTSNENTASKQQSLVIVLPIADQQKAQKILAQPKSLKQGKWVDRTYEGIAIKEANSPYGENFSAALIDRRFLVITDNPKTTERVIQAYKNRTSLANSAGFAENVSKITSSQQPFAQFYINVPDSAKIAAASGNRHLPAQVLTQLQNNQGLAGTVTLESQGIRIKGISWLNPNSRRVLAVENTAARMQNRVPSETLMMVSGVNLQRVWTEYVATSQGNPLAPIAPEQLQKGVKSLTNLDLERDLLSWMDGEFSVAVIPNNPTSWADNFRASLLFMVETSDRPRAEGAFKQLDEVMKNQYQFQIQQTIVAGKPVVNWIGPLGTLTATHGWLDGNVAFLSVGAPIADKIIPRPKNPLAASPVFQKTVPLGLTAKNSQFFLDLEHAAKNFPLPALLPNQQALIAATNSIGMATAVKDSHSNRYEIFLELKKGDRVAPLPSPTFNSTSFATPPSLENHH